MVVIDSVAERYERDTLVESDALCLYKDMNMLDDFLCSNQQVTKHQSLLQVSVLKIRSYFSSWFLGNRHGSPHNPWSFVSYG